MISISMYRPAWACAWACLALLAPVLAPLPAQAGQDRLDTPAYRAPKAAGAMMLDVARAGGRLVAVGEHGIIVVSDDDGKTWRQAEVPVSVTLTAVRFPVPKTGWAVGHDGVILRSDDGGAHWRKQFDGNRANALVLAAAVQREKLAQGGPPALLPAAQAAREDAEAGAKFGPSRPLFGVWFRDAAEGIAVGSFGQIFHTGDGGATWTLWDERIANPDKLHYNAISATGSGALLIAGEAGKVYRSADGGATWSTCDTGYAGQLYGALGIAAEGGAETLLAFGFGGHVFRSTDNGGHWLPAALNEKKPLVSGAVLPDGAVVLLSYDGRILRSADQGQRFAGASGALDMVAASMARLDNGAFIVAGGRGMRPVSINSNQRGQP